MEASPCLGCYSTVGACSTLCPEQIKRSKTLTAVGGLGWREVEQTGSVLGFNLSLIILGSITMELVYRRKKKRRKLVSGVNRKSLEICDKQRLDVQ